MHHYGEDSTEVLETQGAFVIAFRNKVTGREITMYVPRDGVLESGLPLNRVTAENMARDVAHRLREVLR